MGVGQLPASADAANAPEGDDAGAVELRPVYRSPVQRDYEDGKDTLAAIARRHDITIDALRYRAWKENWLTRNRRLDRSGRALLARVYRLLECQTFHMEVQDGPMSDKDAAALTRVTATLERLMAIERLENGPVQARRPSKDLEALRKKIADRFAELSEE